MNDLLRFMCFFNGRRNCIRLLRLFFRLRCQRFALFISTGCFIVVFSRFILLEDRGVVVVLRFDILLFGILRFGVRINGGFA